SMEAYGRAKARLFATPGLEHCVVNIDDPFGAALAAGIDAQRLIATSRNGASSSTPGARFVRAHDSALLDDGIACRIESSWGTTGLRLPLIGAFNLDNALTVLAALLALNVGLDEAVAALAQCSAPPGRLETIGGGAQAPLAIVDYAHTPDALDN